MTSIDTIYIHNSLCKIVSSGWHSVERDARMRPEDKSLALAALVGTWIKHLVLPVAECLDRIQLLERSYVKMACLGGDSPGKPYRDLCAQANKIFFCFLKVLFSPFKATYFAVYSCVKMLQGPLKTAKIEAAEADLNVFLDSVHSNRLAVEHALARAAFERFEFCVRQCATDGDAANLHFLENAQVKEIILHKMHQRKEAHGRIIRSSIEVALFHEKEEQMIDKVITLAYDLDRIENWKDLFQVTITEGDKQISDKDMVEDLFFSLENIDV